MSDDTHLKPSPGKRQSDEKVAKKKINQDESFHPEAENDIDRINSARHLEDIEEEEFIHNQDKYSPESDFIDGFKDGVDTLEDADQWMQLGSMLAGGGIPLDGTQLLDEVVSQEFIMEEASEEMSDISRNQYSKNENNEPTRRFDDQKCSGPSMKPRGKKR